MAYQNDFDVIIVGGSYSGLAAAMALGRALKQVLIIDGGSPCNKQTPYSHNFLTHDGQTPAAIAAQGKQQVRLYDTITFFNGPATGGKTTANGFEIGVASDENFYARKLVFATGIRDATPDIEGFAACWGISVLHCPYCHGYEVRNEKTGVLGNGAVGYEMAKLISNWTSSLALFTNGVSILTTEQTAQLEKHQIAIVEKPVKELEHSNGFVQNIIFDDESRYSLKALYAPQPFHQHSPIPESLGCSLTDDGYITVDLLQETTVKGIFACGDNASRTRTVANAVATGTTAGIAASKQLIFEQF